MAGACKAAGKTLRKSRQNAGSHDPATLYTNRNQQNYKTYLLDRFLEHLDQISKDGDPLEVLDATFDYFRGWLVEGLGYGDGAKGGRPPFDPVSMFKAMILQA